MNTYIVNSRNYYIVSISKSIEGRFLVEANSLEEAWSASISDENLIEVTDAGWDVIWNAEELAEGEELPARIPLALQKQIAENFLP